MNVIRNQEIERDIWQDLFENNRFSTPFQSPEFYNFINSVKGFSAEAIAIEEKGKIESLAVISFQHEPGIKRYFTRRAIIYGGPLIADNSDIALAILLKEISKFFGGSAIYIEIRNLGDYHIYDNIFRELGWQFIPYLNYYLDLTNCTLGEIIAKMTYNRRREIQLSLKNGAFVVECKSENELRDFYTILKNLYKKQVRLPIPSYDFFLNFWKQNIGPVFIVKHNEIIIGGSVCPIMKDNSIYTFYYCGLRDYNKRIFPTHLAIIGALEYAVKNGMKRFDFMGAGKPEFVYGVRKYKKEFGGNLVEYGRFIKVTYPILYRVGRLGVSILKKI